MTINSIKNWFEQAVPNPTDKNRAVQIGCHYEEMSEMASALGNRLTAKNLESMGRGYKTACSGNRFPEIDRKELLDSLCDQIVTAVGVGHMFDLDVETALAEVNRSNWSKFVDGKPVFDANGKIAKPDTYSPPDLTPFV
ncbi:hypothetical protein Acf1_00039 [Acidovorax phage ACF1]|nr:hypothetical protein Acf1_00039 [Acidovorax phage ACF1]